MLTTIVPIAMISVYYLALLLLFKAYRKDLKKSDSLAAVAVDSEKIEDAKNTRFLYLGLVILVAAPLSATIAYFIHSFHVSLIPESKYIIKPDMESMMWGFIASAFIISPVIVHYIIQRGLGVDAYSHYRRKSRNKYTDGYPFAFNMFIPLGILLTAVEVSEYARVDEQAIYVKPTFSLDEVEYRFSEVSDISYVPAKGKGKYYREKHHIYEFQDGASFKGFLPEFAQYTASMADISIKVKLER